MNREGVIGVFDSGIGGTSIWKEIVQRLPNENTLYLADSTNAPYGSKSKEQILALSIKNTERLLDHGAKMVVVACNTATTNAIDHLRATYNIPFIGIEPAIKPAALQSKTGAIGILATKGTLNSSLFHATSAAFATHLNTVEVIGEGLVPLIESGKLASQELRDLLIEYTRPMLDANVDHIVLGCSHYPYLIPILKEILPSAVRIIDSGLAVAKQTENILKKYKGLRSAGSAGHKLFTNGDPAVLDGVLAHFRESAPTTSITVNFLDF